MQMILVTDILLTVDHVPIICPCGSTHWTTHRLQRTNPGQVANGVARIFHS